MPLNWKLRILKHWTAREIPPQFSRSIMSHSGIPWIAAHQASLSITNSQNLLKLMSIELMMPSNHLILCHSLLPLPSIFLSIRVFSSESVLHIRRPKYWSFSFSISPSNEYSGLISFRMDWFQIGKGVGQRCILSPCFFNFYAEFGSVQSLSHV